MSEPRQMPEGFEFLLRDLYFRLGERDQWIDRATNFLLFINGGGASIAVAVLGLVAKRNAESAWTFVPVMCFAVGLVAVGITIFMEASYVRQGRQQLRPLMEAVLRSEMSYTEAFSKMGDKRTFPSQWKWFLRGYWASFAGFLIGLTTVVWLVATTSWA